VDLKSEFLALECFNEYGVMIIKLMKFIKQNSSFSHFCLPC